jgi:hypothetical protein
MELTVFGATGRMTPGIGEGDDEAMNKPRRHREILCVSVVEISRQETCESQQVPLAGGFLKTKLERSEIALLTQ